MRKRIKFSKAANSNRASTTLTGLPAKPDFDEQGMLSCAVGAEARVPYFMDIENEDGKLVQAQVTFIISPEGWTETDPDYFVTLAIKPTRGDTQSYADATVTLVSKDNKAVKAGDDLYDEEVDVRVYWECEGKFGSKNFKVAAGKASTAERITTLPGVSSSSDVLNCTATAIAYLNDSDVASTKEEVPFVIGNRVLNVLVVEATNTEPISYSVSENNQALSDKVKLSITSTNCGFLVQVNAARSKVNYGTIASAEPASSSSSDLAKQIFLSGSGQSCTLTASTKTKTGSSGSFDITAGSSAPFTLNKSKATLSASSKYTGKIWVYLYDSTKSSSDLAAYLNAKDVTSATKLKDSAANNAGNATLDSSKKYIVFAEISGALRVFLL